MKLTEALTSVGIAAFVVLMPSAVHAAWCSNSNYGADNCSFSSFESCLASIRGVGGACTQSRDAAPPAEAAPKTQRGAKPSVKPTTPASGR